MLLVERQLENCRHPPSINAPPKHTSNNTTKRNSKENTKDVNKQNLTKKKNPFLIKKSFQKPPSSLLESDKSAESDYVSSLAIVRSFATDEDVVVTMNWM
ncbi:hypothetical protein CEXT_203191 [Caerostris extrusa]|uniref:Uncharacterized protein n=1 Tax=Caerostris extrusa TaxID=172846 RepID=A0AAV4R269_CAEEX|nr:hypothetical protein CEXT_203191 [Caerostris extrusa]